MKGLIWGTMLGALVLAGCRTDGPVRRAGSGEGQLAKSPWSFERGFMFKGTVTAEYSDMLVLEDKWGKTRYLRIRDDTRYFQDGKLVGREFLAPGSIVRASFFSNDMEMIAREIIILEEVEAEEPLQVRDRPNSLP
jgi:hypothetical protein